jgi:hypothetical protein
MKPFTQPVINNTFEELANSIDKGINIYITPKLYNLLVESFNRHMNDSIDYSNDEFKEIAHTTLFIRLKDAKSFMTQNPYKQLLYSDCYKTIIIKYVVTEPFTIELSEPKSSQTSDEFKCEVLNELKSLDENKSNDYIVKRKIEQLNEITKLIMDNSTYGSLMKPNKDNTIKRNINAEYGKFGVELNNNHWKEYPKSMNDLHDLFNAIRTKRLFDNKTYRYCPYCGTNDTHSLNCPINKLND